MKKQAEEFMKSRRFAIVGVSRNPKKFGNSIYREMKNRGYEVYAVNPSMTEFDGDRCFPAVSELAGKVDAAVLCLAKDRVEPVLREASNAGIRQVWLQQGAETPGALEVGKSLGLNLIAGKCILMYTEPVRSFHAFHRFFVKAFGKY